jgi:hypothetical protein
MNRRDFINKTTIATVAGFTGSMTFSEKADALEEGLSAELDKLVPLPWMCDVTRSTNNNAGSSATTYIMGDDARLPKMPKKPTLMDFIKLRMGRGSFHLLQSAKLAMDADLPEKTILACLLHDVSVLALVRTEHGYWGAQLIEPYVDEEVSWAVRYHQALRFFPDPSVDYEYPESYIKAMGGDYVVPDYIRADAKVAQNHKWYMTARHITINDLYSFDPNMQVTLDAFTDIIGRNFKQPKEGLGFDNSPAAHMWRSMIWPNNYL